MSFIVIIDSCLILLTLKSSLSSLAKFLWLSCVCSYGYITIVSDSSVTLTSSIILKIGLLRIFYYFLTRSLISEIRVDPSFGGNCISVSESSSGSVRLPSSGSVRLSSSDETNFKGTCSVFVRTLTADVGLIGLDLSTDVVVFV